jgi:hypothetical protein
VIGNDFVKHPPLALVSEVGWEAMGQTWKKIRRQKIATVKRVQKIAHYAKSPHSAN